jgi:phosphatidylserine decarboxylase
MKIAPESTPVLLPLFGLVLAGWAVGLPAWVAWIAAPLVIGCALFFRDPERRTPDEPGILVSPADGRVLAASASRVSIFLSLFDVHVCRAPASGRVRALDYRSGAFHAAFKDAASQENERLLVDLDSDRGAVRFALVAGLVARRIVPRIGRGQEVRIGEPIGVIRFGSRVDVDLPPGARLSVGVGDRVRAGESVIARTTAPAG